MVGGATANGDNNDDETEPTLTAALDTSTADHRQRLTNFYQLHNPIKLKAIDKTMTKYEGKYEQMFSALGKKYKCVVPPYGTSGVAPVSDIGTKNRTLLEGFYKEYDAGALKEGLHTVEKTLNEYMMKMKDLEGRLEVKYPGSNAPRFEVDWEKIKSVREQKSRQFASTRASRKKVAEVRRMRSNGATAATLREESYTAVQCDLAGYTAAELAPLCVRLPLEGEGDGSASGWTVGEKILAKYPDAPHRIEYARITEIRCASKSGAEAEVSKDAQQLLAEEAALEAAVDARIVEEDGALARKEAEEKGRLAEMLAAKEQEYRELEEDLKQGEILELDGEGLAKTGLQLNEMKREIARMRRKLDAEDRAVRAQAKDDEGAAEEEEEEVYDENGKKAEKQAQEKHKWQVSILVGTAVQLVGNFTGRQQAISAYNKEVKNSGRGDGHDREGNPLVKFGDLPALQQKERVRQLSAEEETSAVDQWKQTVSGTIASLKKSGKPWDTELVMKVELTKQVDRVLTKQELAVVREVLNAQVGGMVQSKRREMLKKTLVREGRMKQEAAKAAVVEERENARDEIETQLEKAQTQQAEDLPLQLAEAQARVKEVSGAAVTNIDGIEKIMEKQESRDVIQKQFDQAKKQLEQAEKRMTKLLEEYEEDEEDPKLKQELDTARKTAKEAKQQVTKIQPQLEQAQTRVEEASRAAVVTTDDDDDVEGPGDAPDAPPVAAGPLVFMVVVTFDDHRSNSQRVVEHDGLFTDGYDHGCKLQWQGATASNEDDEYALADSIATARTMSTTATATTGDYPGEETYGDEEMPELGYSEEELAIRTDEEGFFTRDAYNEMRTKWNKPLTEQAYEQLKADMPGLCRPARKKEDTGQPALQMGMFMEETRWIDQPPGVMTGRLQVQELTQIHTFTDLCLSLSTPGSYPPQARSRQRSGVGWRGATLLRSRP
jgi:hypothetical protein